MEGLSTWQRSTIIIKLWPCCHWPSVFPVIVPLCLCFLSLSFFFFLCLSPGSFCQIECDLCGHRCMTQEGLDLHRMSHTGQTPLKCPVRPCRRRFTSNAALEQHVLAHIQGTLGNSKNRPRYRCQICHKEFAYNSTFSVHMRIHTDERPFEVRSVDLISVTFSNISSFFFLNTGAFQPDVYTFQTFHLPGSHPLKVGPGARPVLQRVLRVFPPSPCTCD